MEQDFLKKHGKVIKAIAISISKDSNGIKELLKRNGVDTSFVKSKKDLTDIFVQSLAKSKGLGSDFHKYIISKSNRAGYNSVDGTIDFNYTPDDSLFDFSDIKVDGGYNTDLTPIDTNTELENSSGFWSGLSAKDLLNMGMGIFSMQRDMQVSSDNQKAVSDAVNSGRVNDDLEGTPTKSNTTMYIVLGVLGVSLLGGIIYYYNKKK